MGAAEVIVDASALLAILFAEPEGTACREALAAASRRPAMSPFNYLEAAVRVDRLDAPKVSAAFEELLEAFDVEITSAGPEQALLAREAYRRFGKGNHPARLNIGDCFAYALSRARGEPLLFKGDDFRRTDVEAVL
ncbi:MAG: type II toxin-antitoxin system VapC family toxin [Pararhizobium sp.]